MKSNEVQKETGLTRKAIEYYELQGLLEPNRDENGYRNYSDSDVQMLKKISLFRQLGLNLTEIVKIANSGSEKQALADIVRDKSIRLEIDQKRQELLSSLMNGMLLDDLPTELKAIEAQEAIYERLCRTFPGYLGQSLFINYRPYLQGTIVTEAQQEAYDNYVNFLDQMPELKLTQEEQEFMEEVSSEISLEMLDRINAGKTSAIENTQKWLEENASIISAYEQMKNSEELKSLPIWSIQKKLKALMAESGYYEIAIPLLRQMSPAYDEYYNKLLKSEDDYQQWMQNNN